MWKHLCVFWFASVCLFVCTGYELTQWHMGNECGITIARGLSAGELVFRADDFRSYSGDTCMVVIKLDDESGIQERTVLYFTEFKLDTSCGDNVIVVNGDWSGDWRGNPSAADVVTGLPMQLCGHNKSLEESEARFFTVDHIFTVIYHRTGSLPGNNETFVMKFASYHEGECDTDRYYKCSNDHCISKDLHCHGDIEACGEKDSNCLTADEIEAIVTTILDILKDIVVDFAYLVFICITLAILRCIYKGCKRRHGSARHFPIIKNILSRTERPTRRPQTDESVSLASARDNDAQLAVEEEMELDQSFRTVASIPDNNVTSSEDTSASAPAYDTLNADNYMTSPVDNATFPSAPAYDTLNVTSDFSPPPTYDQVMSNQNVYGYKGTN